MDIRSSLQNNYQKLLETYESNLEAVLELQSTLVKEVLPHLEAELQLSAEAVEWTKDWLEDTASFFQLCRRQNFTKSLSMEAARKNLIWRLHDLLPSLSHSPSPIVRCLPVSAHDPFGRPIIVVRAADFIQSAEDIKRLLLPNVELLRRHLKGLNNGEPAPHSTRPVLQYVVLLDLKDVSFQNINVDVLSWTLRDVIPRFPGMLAAVFMINYSWAHSGMWAVVKSAVFTSDKSYYSFQGVIKGEYYQHLLSLEFFSRRKSTLSNTLHDHRFHEVVISHIHHCRWRIERAEEKTSTDYGGILPPLEHLDDPLRPTGSESLSFDALVRPPSPRVSTEVGSPPQKNRASRIPSISPTSFLNPFFGYPVSPSADTSHSALPTLHHGRRRKRDLLRTLAMLWWMRHKTSVRLGFWLVTLAISVRLWVRIWSHSANGLALWRTFWSTAISF